MVRGCCATGHERVNAPSVLRRCCTAPNDWLEPLQPQPAPPPLPLFQDLFDCDTEQPRLPDGRRGFLLQPTVNGTPFFVPHGDRTCASPLEQLNVAAATIPYAEMTAGGSVPNATAVAAGVTGSAGRRPQAISSTSGGAREWLAKAVAYDPVEDSEVASWATGGRREHTLRRWALLAPLLTLYRNSPTATLHRDTSVFDVFATSRTTLGLCMDEECAIKIAVDTVRGGRPVVNTTSVPLLQFRGLDGLSMGVDMADGGLLSLGRSVWGQPPATRLGGASGPWPFGGLYFHVDADTQDAGRPVFVLQTPSEGYVAGGADLSADLERLLCLQPVGSFVRGQADTCLGRPPSLAVNPNAKALWLVNGEAAPTLRARTPRSSRQAGIRVTVRNAAQPWLPPPCTDDVFQYHSVDHPQRRPLWLVGPGARELNQDSPNEVDLARRSSRCSLNLSELTFTVSTRLAREALETDFQALLTKWAAVYDRPVFGMEPPREPASNAELIFAVLVVLPEVVALFVLVLDAAAWGRCRVLAFALIALSGLAALVGIASLTATEVAGAAWSAASARDVLAVPYDPRAAGRYVDARDAANEEGRGAPFPFFSSLPAVRMESVIQVVRTGYRVRLVVGVCAAMCAIYAALAAFLLGVLGWQLRVRRRHRRQTWPSQTDIGAPSTAVAGRPRPLTVRAAANIEAAPPAELLGVDDLRASPAWRDADVGTGGCVLPAVGRPRRPSAW